MHRRPRHCNFIQQLQRTVTLISINVVMKLDVDAAIFDGFAEKIPNKSSDLKTVFQVVMLSTSAYLTLNMQTKCWHRRWVWDVLHIFKDVDISVINRLTRLKHFILRKTCLATEVCSPISWNQSPLKQLSYSLCLVTIWLSSWLGGHGDGGGYRSAPADCILNIVMPHTPPAETIKDGHSGLI